MKTIETVIATSRVDRHGDLITVEALREAEDRLRQGYLPVLFNHDPRVPPLGRAVDAEVRQTEDGSFQLVGKTEIFEPGDDLPFDPDGRRMIVREFESDKLTLVADRSYTAAEDWESLEALSEELDAGLERFEKKALEPISVLLLAVTGAAAAFASGFLNKMGGDAWDAAKPRLTKLLGRRRDDREEFLFIFEVLLVREEGPLSVQCTLTSPTEDEMERFWSDGLEQLEQQLPPVLAAGPKVSRVVLHYQNGAVVPGFAVRSDCVPLKLGDRSPETSDDG